MTDDFVRRKLNDMDSKLERLKAQMHTVSFVTKKHHKEELLAHFKAELSKSEQGQRVWLAADDWKTQEQLMRDAGVAKGTMNGLLKRLCEEDVLERNEEGLRILYKRSDATAKLGLEKVFNAKPSKPESSSEPS